MLNLADNGFYLSHLLPYAKNSYINKRMTILKISDFIMFVIDGINHAIHDFLSYNITAFDPHVGESLCQIRACYVLNIFKNHHNDKTYIDNLSTLSQELRCITERIINLKQRVGKLNKLDRLNLDVLIKTENIDTKLDCTVFYMFLCNFLTRFTIFNTLENSVVDYEKMESFSGFSKNFLRKVVHHYQKLTSKLSCIYVMSIYEEYNSSKIKKSVIDLSIQIDDDGRFTLPLYMVTTILFDFIEKNAIGIMIVLRSNVSENKELQVNYYAYNEIKEKHVLSNPNCETKESPCIVIHAQTDLSLSNKDNLNTLTHLINEIGVKDCILANMAAHPQYSGRKLTGIKNFFLTPIISCSNKSISDNALLLLESYVNHKLIAENYGCSDSRQSLFYIRHIFCDYVDHQLSLVTNGVFYSDVHRRMPIYYKEERFQNSDSIVVEA